MDPEEPPTIQQKPSSEVVEDNGWEELDEYLKEESNIPTDADKKDVKRATMLGRCSSFTGGSETLSMQDFELILVLGRGSFGKVYLAKLRDKELYVIKSIKKNVLLEESKVEKSFKRASSRSE